MNKPTKTPAAKAIELGRSRLILSNAFWGTLQSRLIPTETTAVPTMATDGTRLVFNPDYTLGLSEAEILGVLTHEVAHCANMHHLRRGDRDLRLWNIACDLQVNGDVRACGFVLPGQPRTLAQFQAGQKGYLYDPAYRDKGVEEIYRLICEAQEAMRPPPPPPPAPDEDHQGPDGQPGGGPDGDKDEDRDEDIDGAEDGSPEPQGASPDDQTGEDGAGVAGEEKNAPTGSGGPGNDGSPAGGEPKETAPDPGGCGAVLDAAPAHDPVAQAEADREWQTVVRQAAAIARTQHAGTLPDFIRRLIEEMDNPRVDWRQELRRFTDLSVHKDFTWRRPNRRHLWRRLVLPGLVSDRPAHVVIVQDTSGSVYHGNPQEMFRSEMQSILDDGACDRITVIQADTRIAAEPVTYEAGELIEMEAAGGGGTAFREALDWIAENIEDAAAIIYLTDCETSDWGDEPACPVLWAVYGSEDRARAAAAEAPFGEALFIGD